MRLFDHFLAARNTPADVAALASIMAAQIQKAQRFEIADEVVRAAHELVKTRPSTLLAALPLCRVPYESIWLEYRGGLFDERPREYDGAPVPWKQGALIEAVGATTGHMTFGWMHTRDTDPNALPHAINISPISIYFDWREDGNAASVALVSHVAILEWLKRSKPDAPITLIRSYMQHLESSWMGSAISLNAINAIFTSRSAWAGFKNDPREIEAMRELNRHMCRGLSPFGGGLIALLFANADKSTLHHFTTQWEKDVQGEGGWVQAFLAMLNSRNPVVEHAPAELEKLNKARRRNGKPALLPYSKTRLSMSRSQERIARARGIDHEAARQHLVRGHFKIRRTGIFWWSPFLRGDARRGEVRREEYEVQE